MVNMTRFDFNCKAINGHNNIAHIKAIPTNIRNNMIITQGGKKTDAHKDNIEPPYEPVFAPLRAKDINWRIIF